MPRPRTHSHSLSLSERINSATRAAHTHLNNLILERLPLALPPHANDTFIYASGLIHIASIYFTFEDLWQRSLQPPYNADWKIGFDSLALNNLDLNSELRNSPAACDVKSTSHLQNPGVSPRIDSVLRLLRLPDLTRSESLRADIANLMSIEKDDVTEKIQLALKNSSASKFLHHIRNNVTQNPHVLMAYAWVLYMALFSGGRYIFASLKKAAGRGIEFWEQDPCVILQHYQDKKGSKPEEQLSVPLPSTKKHIPAYSTSSTTIGSKTIPGLQFFCFTGDENGEDIKTEFKKRFKTAENLLTNNEKIEIILEAQYIFKYMIEIVLNLDMLLGTDNEDKDTSSIILESNSFMKIRDSVCVTKERLLQKTSTQRIKETWESIFLDYTAKNRMKRVVGFKKPFTFFKGRRHRLKKCLQSDCSANFSLTPGLTDINTLCKKFGFSISLLLRLVILFLMAMALKLLVLWVYKCEYVGVNIG
ncbi:hypothetical protein HI914_06841 [Erysiphe necator]|nr:hypothetical protein HI914_06841 [Erysiphe necator]